MQIVYGSHHHHSLRRRRPLRPLTTAYFQLTPSASSTDVTAGKDNVFQMCFTDPDQGIASAQYIAGTRPGHQGRRDLQQRRRLLHRHLPGLHRRGRRRWAWRSWLSTTFTDDTNTDFSVQLTAAKDGGR